jgi:predicted N-acetyltransferase YhbS
VGDGSRRTVLALAHVASDPTFRGLGLGARVVRAALGRLALEGGATRCFLFQTGVEAFYLKLGARTLPAERHPICNSTGQGSDAKRRAGFW